MAENRLLANLSPDLLSRIAPQLDEVSLDRRAVLTERGRDVDYVYFPVTALASVVANFRDGRTIEAALIGNDGFVGISALFGTRQAVDDAFIQIAGDALRLRIEDFWSHLEDQRFRDALGAFSLVQFGRIAQSTGCIAFHPVEQRLARWLLMVRDATEQNEFALTQEFLGIMLGVARPTVTLTIRLLQNAGLIEHRRGLIRIADPVALQATACECYASPE